MLNQYLAHVYDTRDGLVFNYIGARHVLANDPTTANQAMKDTLLVEHLMSYANDPKYDHYVELQEVAQNV